MSAFTFDPDHHHRSLSREGSEMTVKALIEKLESLPEEAQNAEVFANHCRDCGGNEVSDAKVVEWGVLLV